MIEYKLTDIKNLAIFGNTIEVVFNDKRVKQYRNVEFLSMQMITGQLHQLITVKFKHLDIETKSIDIISIEFVNKKW